MTPVQMAESGQGAFSRAVLNGFAEALTSACGDSWLTAAMNDTPDEDSDAERVRFRISVEGDLNGSFNLELLRTDAIVVAASMLREDEGEYGEIESASLLELMQVATERFQPERGEKYKNLKFSVSADAEPQPEVCTFEATISSEEGKRISVSVHLDEALNGMLTRKTAEEKVEAEEPAQVVAVKPDDHEYVIPENMNLDLVMDVDLNVTLRFGKRQLTLREVLELTSGSVVELDRQVEEPVELLLNGVLIAKGEAVVVDGNYGLRVLEVAHPSVSSSMVHRAAAYKMQSATA
jgi:flagellar motor switch protein FliN/FliY